MMTQNQTWETPHREAPTPKILESRTFLVWGNSTSHCTTYPKANVKLYFSFASESGRRIIVTCGRQIYNSLGIGLKANNQGWLAAKLNRNEPKCRSKTSADSTFMHLEGGNSMQLPFGQLHKASTSRNICLNLKWRWCCIDGRFNHLKTTAP